jgi:Restriction endonuclease
VEIVVKSLGRTAKVIGDNLERLVKELLARQGFGSFARNSRKTGAEIDLRAVHRFTGQPLIIECKAHERPIDTGPVKTFYAEWQKERGRLPQQFGSILSLSGFSGTARQWHSELSQKAQRDFVLRDGFDLLRQLEEVGLVLSGGAVAKIVTARYGIPAPTVVWLTYSEHGFAWILRHPHEDKDILTIAGPEGGPLPTWKVSEIQKLVRKHFRSAEAFGMATREGIQLALLDRENQTSEDLAGAVNESKHDVGATVAMLIREGRLVANSGGKLSFRRDVVQFVNTAREFLELRHGPQLVGSPFAADILSSPEFMSYLDTRYRLGMTPEEARGLTALLRMSPGALEHALFVDPARYRRTREHIDEILKEGPDKAKWLMGHRTTLLQECVFHAVHDLTASEKAYTALLAKLDIKRVRLVAEIVAVGLTWQTLRVRSESNRAISVAGGAIPAGSLVCNTNPAGESLWDGLLWAGAEDFDRAGQAFSETLAESRKSGNVDLVEAALNNLATVSMRTGAWGQALVWLEELFALREPASAAVYSNMIVCLMETGVKERTAVMVTRALERFPELAKETAVARFRAENPDSETVG